MHSNGKPGFIGFALCRICVHNAGMKYGYARVSTDGQSVAAQVADAEGAGAEKVFKEVASGANDPTGRSSTVLLTALNKATCCW